MIRIIASAVPPGGPETTIVIGLFGNTTAIPGEAAAAIAIAKIHFGKFKYI
ncbi:hypothetical protein Tamer19_12180 [Cupriavidus sp. TA19]|nr:hypothetical protein Tamer19_12180 [Cupriavidus sp. TA19]